VPSGDCGRTRSPCSQKMQPPMAEPEGSRPGNVLKGKNTARLNGSAWGKYRAGKDGAAAGPVQKVNRTLDGGPDRAGDPRPRISTAV